MADCRETIAELDAFLDGELSDDVKAHIDAHLNGCTDCLSAFDFQAVLTNTKDAKAALEEAQAAAERLLQPYR